MAAIDQQIADLETNTELEPAERDEALKLLGMAKDARERAQALEEDTANFDRIAANSAGILADLAQQKAALVDTHPEARDFQGADDLARQIVLLESQNAELVSALDSDSEELTDLTRRSTEIPNEIADIRQDIASSPDVEADSTSTLSAVETARVTLEEARRDLQRIKLETLLSELQSVPSRKSILTARISLAEAQMAQLVNVLSELRTKLADTRLGIANAAIKQAQEDIRTAEDQAPIRLAEYARENLVFAETLRESATRELAVQRRTSEYRQQDASVGQSVETVERVLATGSLTEELGDILRQVRATLPRPTALRQALATSEKAQIDLQLNQILWQERLRNLTQSDAYIANMIGGDAAGPVDPDTRELASSLILARRDTLTRLLEDARSEADELSNQEIAIRSLLRETEDLSALLDRRLLWLQTDAALGPDWFTSLPSGVAWLLSPTSWSDAVTDMLNAGTQALLSTTLILVLVVGLVLLRPFFIRQLDPLSERVGHVGRDTYWTTPLALSLGILLALPSPFLFATAGSLLNASGSESAFSSALGPALLAISFMLGVLLIFREMARPNGVFDGHFGWDTTASTNLHRHLFWFAWVQAAAAFVFAISIASGNETVRYGVGLIGFGAGSIGIAIFAWQFLKPNGGVVALTTRSPRLIGLLKLCIPFLVAAPLINGALPIFGYFDAAVELQTRVFQTGLLLLVAATVYGILMREFLVANRRLALQRIRKHREKLEEARSEQAEPSGDAVPSTIADTGLDPEKTSMQVRNIFLTIAGVILTLGLWMTWSPLIPALGIADDIVLWQSAQLVDDVSVVKRVTLWNLALCFGLLVGGLIIARNIRGLLEVSVFQRMGMDAGSRYAAVTIAGYVIVAVGIVSGLAQLGLDWSKLQWIVAALGVGLGFGLQEIVANFVSGLIILFERPVRVGDTVTIGDLSGTVSNIRIRATTVTDFENREVLLPNKSIITQNVTNWTLNDSITRLLLTVGVAYGSDIEQVRNLIAKVVTDHADALEIPQPTVFFMNHGDSSLDFEIRVFVGSPALRLPVSHDLNAAINRTLTDHGISIPFPQRDLHVHGLEKLAEPSAKERDE